MAGRRRVGAETSQTRAVMLDVTERIMLADGYAAVTSRRVAAEAGVTAGLVHYYFATIDDLFLAVLRRRADQQLQRQQRILAQTDRPLHALWQLAKDEAGTGLVLELTSLANHRKVVRSELRSSAERHRRARLDALREHIERRVDPDAIPPIVVLVLIDAIGQDLVLEKSIGMDVGHADTIAVVERYLDELEGTA